MRELLAWGDTLPAAYHDALFRLINKGEFHDCADWGTSQLEASMTICVEHPLQEPMISKLFIGGPEELEQYRQEMLDGILDFEVEKGNWTYTYHDRMVNYYVDNAEYRTDTHKYNYAFNQIDFVINELTRNPSSRRAVILIRDNSEDAFSDDPACLQHIQYFLHDNKLDCKVLFRSNDACKAAFMNMFALILLQKKIADTLGAEVGHYVHRANSFHCYAKDSNTLNSYATRIIASEELNDGFAGTTFDRGLKDLAYNYVGEWDELMEEAKPKIAKKVEELKNR